jgi:hypothetical protein
MSKYSRTSAYGKLIRSVRLRVLAGKIRDAELRDDKVVGHWEEKLEPRFNLHYQTIAENFLNSKDILNFTKHYGPLGKPDLRNPDASFRQSVEEWWNLQEEMRSLWRLSDSVQGFKIGMRKGELLQITPRDLIIDVESLMRFMEWEIFLQPSARRRICAHPHCEHPYFIATRSDQKFCSKECGEWAQREHKRAWWAEHGPQWRKRRDRGKGRRGQK